MKKSKFLIACLCVGLSIVTAGFFTLNGKTNNNDIKVTRTVNTEIDYQSMLETSFDSYSLETSDTEISLDATKAFTVTLDQLDNLSLDQSLEGSTINVEYNIEYDLENNYVYLTTTFTDYEGVIEMETLQGAVFYNESGELDAVFNVDGEPVLMSEMADIGTVDQCGFFSKLVKIVKKVAVVVAVAAAVVAVATVVVATAGAGAVAVAGVGASVGVGTIAVGTTTIGVAVTAATIAAVAVGVYVLADAIAVTTDVLVQAARELERKLEPMHMPAFLVGNTLQIIPVPVARSKAAKAIPAGQSFWTITSTWARDLAVMASGGAIGWENHGPTKGYYNHYHLLGRAGGHSFFGGPGGIAI